MVVLPLTGCSQLSFSKSHILQISISVTDQDRIRFSGKGAGAGMMMSSSMGVMGIAIGVAIDEGIGKDIHTAFVEDGGNFSLLVQSETESWLSTICAENEKPKEVCESASQLHINIYRYGFVTISGEDDPVKPELDIGFILDKHPEMRLNLNDTDLSSAQLPLSDAKSKGKQVANSLRLGYQTILEQYQNSFTLQ
jgi:hypothetical protein